MIYIYIWHLQDVFLNCYSKQGRKRREGRSTESQNGFLITGKAGERLQESDLTPFLKLGHFYISLKIFTFDFCVTQELYKILRKILKTFTTFVYSCSLGFQVQPILVQTQISILILQRYGYLCLFSAFRLMNFY